MLRDSADDYAARGFKKAWEILADGCEIPPSLEVFEEELMRAQLKNPSLDSVRVARRLASTYNRVAFKGFTGFDDGG